MDRKIIIYLTASVIAVICTACLVLASDKKSDDEITITVMNSGTVEVVQTESTQTKSETTAVPETKTTVSSTVTVVSSISTNPEQEITETQPAYSDCEVLCVDINTADTQELMLLDGIGEVTAEAIINYREENGGFRNIEEIMNVYGIGEAKFEKIREYIYVQNPVYDYEDEIFQEYEEPETVAETSEEVTETELTLENCSPVDINTAGPEILMLLPYVDEQIAQDIITLRSELNGFTNIYELLYIDKLSQKQVAELTEFVTVGQ